MMVISGRRHEATSLIVVLMERYFRTELMWHSWFVSNILMMGVGGVGGGGGGGGQAQLRYNTGLVTGRLWV